MGIGDECLGKRLVHLRSRPKPLGHAPQGVWGDFHVRLDSPSPPTPEYEVGVREGTYDRGVVRRGDGVLVPDRPRTGCLGMGGVDVDGQVAAECRRQAAYRSAERARQDLSPEAQA